MTTGGAGQSAYRGPLELREESLAGEPAQRLLAGFVAEISHLYPGWTPQSGPSAAPADFAPPGGRFLVAYVDGEPAACAGLKRLDRDAAEIKRLYVRPELRGRGLARRLLEELEAAAGAAGYRVVRLDTGANQREALRLFEVAGYRPIPDYNDNPFASHWFEKTVARVQYEWRGEVTDDELVALTESHGGRSVRGWWDQIRPYSLGWLTARDGDRSLVGFVNVAWDGGDHAFLLDPKVRPDRQRQGVGTELVRRAAAHAKEAGCEWLHVDFDDELAPFYFGACAFRPTAAGLIHLLGLSTGS